MSLRNRMRLKFKFGMYPLDGRPDSFIGAIGSFTVVSELSPTTARVGDPLTLAITLKGKGLLSDAQPPRLDSVAEINAGLQSLRRHLRNR